MVTCSFGILDETPTKDRTNKYSKEKKTVGVITNLIIQRLMSFLCKVLSKKKEKSSCPKVWKVTGDTGAHHDNERTSYTENKSHNFVPIAKLP